MPTVAAPPCPPSPPLGPSPRDHLARVSVYFSIHHAVSTVPLVYSAALLPGKAGYYGNGALFFAAVLSGLFISVPAADALGMRVAMLLGLAFYSTYSLLFCLALAFNIGEPFVLGSCVGGVGAGLLWTTQVGYFAHTSELVARRELLTAAGRERVREEVAKGFAFWYLVFEFLAKVSFSALQLAGLRTLLVSSLFVACGLAVFALMVATLLGPGAPDDGEGGGPPESGADPWETRSDEANRHAASFVRLLPRVAGTIRLWSDPRIWLLSTTNITFGFSSAFCNGWLNKNHVTAELGESAIGVLSGLSVAAAAVMVQVFSILSRRFGKGLVLTMGTACMGSISYLVLSGRCCFGWGGKLVYIFLLQGAGRAVYESTNKAAFMDAFPGKDNADAFANCFVQTSVASAACYMLTSTLSGMTAAQIILFMAALTPGSFAFAASFRDHLQLEVAPERAALLSSRK